MEEINGIIIINKPKNYTSHDVVSKVKRILKLNKVGHTGTLDPNATGVLPLLLNKGTKLSKYLIEHDKEYEVTLKLGIRTDTLDGEGNIIEKHNVNCNKLQLVEETLDSFIGKQKQIPPMYSAIKVNGKKLYEYARSGQIVEIKPREIEIYDIKLQQINKKDNEILFKVSCSKGTYIRTLCEDIAKKLGTIGYMKELNRTKVGFFTLNQSITLEEIENNKENIIKEKLITIKELLKDKPNIELDSKKLELFLNGSKLNTKKENGIYKIYLKGNKFIGTGIVENNILKRDIII